MSNLGKRKADDFDEEDETEFLQSLPKAPKQELTEAQIMDVVNQLVEDAGAKPAAQASKPRKKVYRKKKTYRKKYRSSRYARYTRPMVYPTLLPPMPVMPYPPSISSAIPPPMQQMPSPMLNPSICHPAHPYYGGAPPNPWGYR